MNVRATIIVKGRVSSVGYREFVDERAFPLELTGHVRELAEGHVEVVCEGERELIQAFIKRISIVMYPVRVTGLEVRYSDATGEFPDFRIVRDGGPLSELCERLEHAMRCVRDMRLELLPLEDLRGLLSRLLVVQHRALERLDRAARLQQEMLGAQQRILIKVDRVRRDGHAGLEIGVRLLRKQDAAVAAVRSLDRHDEERMARLGRKQERLANAISTMTPAGVARKRKRRVRKDAIAPVPGGAEGAPLAGGNGPGPTPDTVKVEGGIAG